MRTRWGLALAGALAVTTARGEDVTRSLATYETGTIRAVGPNTACSGDQFFNVEGADYVDFASYAVVRFDAGQARAEFDAMFGSGNWTLTGARLDLVQTGASFAVAGFVDVNYSTDDTTDCKTSASPLKYPFNDGGGDDLPAEFITQWFFSPGVAGDVDTLDLSGSASLLADLGGAGDGVATLVLVDGDATVATSHRGQDPFNDRTNGINFRAARLVLTAQGSVVPPTTIEVNAQAEETGTIQQTGPRGPCNGDRFFNVEGVNNGTFASYGVLRFDTSGAAATLDAVYGANNWTVTGLSLRLVQEVAAFSVSGFVDFYYSTDDATDCKTTNGGLAYPLIENDIPDMPIELLTQTFFSVGVTGDVDIINLGPVVEEQSLVDGFFTIVVNEGEAGVAATWRGQAPFGLARNAPRLLITAEGGGGGEECLSDGCNGGEGFKTKTRAKSCGCQAKMIITGGTPGAVYGITTPMGECVRKAANARGKVVVKECPSQDGTAKVESCGLQKDVDCL